MAKKNASEHEASQKRLSKDTTRQKKTRKISDLSKK